MHHKSLKFFALFTFLFVCSTIVCAQPGGPGGPPPGGFPGGGFPGGPRGDRQRQQTQQKSTTVKQKKNVKAGSTFKVVGSLIDSTKNEPLMYCNVALLEKEDSSFVKGASTDVNGYFELRDVPAGEYLIRASYMGYATRFVPVKVSNNTAVGSINMKASSSVLKTVTVKAARPLYAVDGEKMVYNVADDPTIQAGTTEDALQNAPGVEVDVEGNITLRGVSSVEIWVNDKPSKLTSENLKTYLQTLPANALDRIETITNPSAKYATDAEAVINIITSAHIKKNHFISFGANVATQPNISPWVSYTWANEKLNINLFTNFRYSTSQNDSWSWSRTRQDNPLYPGILDSLQDVIYERDSSWSEGSNLSGSIGLHIDYEIDSMTDAGVWGNFNLNGSSNSSDRWHSRDVYLPTPFAYQYDMMNDVSSTNFFGMFGGSFTKKFDRNGHNLRAFLFGSTSNNNTGTSYSRLYNITDTTSTFDQNTFKYYDDPYRGTDVSLRLRYNRPYSKDGEMSYGLNLGTDNDYRDYRPYLLDTTYDDGVTVLNDNMLDALRRFTFEDHNNEVGADVEWTHRWGGFTLQLGMGANLSHDHFSFTETATPDEYSVTHITYNPSIHLSYRTQSMHNYKLNYSLRMRNPSATELTTYRNYTEDSYKTGNRDLTQSFTHNAEAGWTKFFMWGSLGVEGYGRLSTGEIDNLTDVTDAIDPYIGRIIQYSTPYNIGSSWRYGTSLNATFRPSGFFNLRLYANVYDYGYSMQYDKLGQEAYEDSKWSYSIRLNMWTKVWNKYQIHASANYSSPTLGLMSTRSARYWVNMGVRADFFNRKLSAFINVQDIFNWGKNIGNTSSNTNPYYLSESKSRTLNSRYISAGITLRFGKMELEKNTQSGSEAEGTSTDTTSTSN